MTGIMARRGTAGASSFRTFRQLRRATIRREWRDLAVLSGAIAVLVALVLTQSEWRRTVAAFFLGAATALMAFGWMLGFDARSLRWLWGAAGEEWTEAELRKLGSDWRVFHDIPDRAGNWDHIVVGPPGVFAIDSKNLSVPAIVDQSGLRAGRLRFGGGAARGSACD